MVQRVVPVHSKEEVADGLYVLRFVSNEIAKSAKPGQFLNVRAVEGLWGPLLRRPFSISMVQGDLVDLLFNVIGTGTKLLASKRAGDALDVLGPLGRPFETGDDYQTAIIVGGGLGIAPFPILTKEFVRLEKAVITFVGARTSNQLYVTYLREVQISTDDGSSGFHGNVVQLLEDYLNKSKPSGPKIFGCGPPKMLQALSNLAKKREIPCELSLEGDMACGMGICQGCPVERASGTKKYALVCTEGPTFNCKEVIL